MTSGRGGNGRSGSGHIRVQKSFACFSDSGSYNRYLHEYLAACFRCCFIDSAYSNGRLYGDRRVLSGVFSGISLRKLVMKNESIRDYIQGTHYRKK